MTVLKSFQPYKTLFILLITCICLFSCTEIYFVKPQPKGVKTLENGLEELIGEYVSNDDDDTLKISKDGIYWSDEESVDEVLQTVIQIKKYRGQYFVNIFNKEKRLWQLFVVKYNDAQGLYVTNMTSIDDDDKEDLAKKKFSQLIIDEEEGGTDEYFLFDPSKRQLRKLLNDPVFEENKINLNKLKPR